ncbi:hypothetical protein GCM10023085_72730 [Actinomadura viridis]|uniref:NitT/TauT family transport system substrate-binding protein n=1 Tax=Actinomadura viridis TaxID=58110 RepID=A0A931DQM7_9ACTN|nr:ABC transporter substrate-binding protein [Actinomadura viridis]MBG6092968.1 NitT/TauT family transport system substrate-binding protein [Actinomadura viridis]
MKLVIAVLVAAGLAAGACTKPPDTAATGAGGMPKLRCVGAGASLNQGVPQLMDTAKLDEKNGVDVEYKALGTSSATQVAGVLGGDYDCAAPATTAAFAAIGKGSDLTIVGGINKGASILAIRKDAARKSGVAADAPMAERIKALKGLKIVTAAAGSGNQELLVLLLKHYGLDPKKDVTITGVTEASAIVGGLRQGRFDAGFYGSGVMEANIASGEAQLWASVPRGDMKEVFGDAVTSVIIMRRSYAEKNPDVVRKLSAALAATSRQVAEDPEGSGAQLRQGWFPQISEEVWKLTWEQGRLSFPADGKFPRTSFDAVAKLVPAEVRNGLEYEKAVDPRARG